MFQGVNLAYLSTLLKEMFIDIIYINFFFFTIILIMINDLFLFWSIKKKYNVNTKFNYFHRIVKWLISENTFLLRFNVLIICLVGCCSEGQCHCRGHKKSWFKEGRGCFQMSQVHQYQTWQSSSLQVWWFCLIDASL